MAQSLANPNLVGPAGRRFAAHASGWEARRWLVSGLGRTGIGRIALEAAVLAVASVLTAWSAAVIKQGGRGPALLAVSGTAMVNAERGVAGSAEAARQGVGRTGGGPSQQSLGGLSQSSDAGGGERPESPAGLIGAAFATDPATGRVSAEAAPPTDIADPRVRWFNGRPIRPAHVVWMTVTAYTPGAESCWPSDDGQTATLHCVTTNGGALVAADTGVLPFGSLVSVEGYDASRIVPVLDRGGKIRGQRLDVLMETVEQARDWGVRRVPVVVWEYADGREPTDPRRVR
jgi:3D (Asp-Asp-Asp) domain-containing protein